MNAVIYARFSSYGQTEQSIEGQLKDCYAFAEREGYAVVGEYIDRAKSARSDDRPDFQRMVKDAEKKQFQAILVWKLDRFARNRYDSAIYKAKLKKHGVKVISAMENIGDSPEGIILEGMLESMAEYYSANLSLNVRRGQRETAAKGRWCGGQVPLGYKPVDGRLVADERTAPAIRKLFQMYVEGARKKDIVTAMNAMGLRNKRGRDFGESTCDWVLKNPTYVGRHTWNGQVIEGCADAIIDEATFEAAQRRLSRVARAPASAKAKVEYQLQGKVFCGYCGANMIGESGHGRSAIYHYYTCSTRKKSRGCHKRPEKKDFIEWYIVEQTALYVLDPDRIDAIAEAVVAEYKKEINASALSDLERNLARADADINVLVDSLLEAPKTVHARIYERIELLEAQKAELDIEIARLRIALGIRFTVKEVQAWMKQFCNGDPLDPIYRKRIIDVFINSVYLYDDKTVIFYNIRDGQQVSIITPDPDLDFDLDDPPDGSSMTLLLPPAGSLENTTFSGLSFCGVRVRYGRLTTVVTTV